MHRVLRQELEASSLMRVFVPNNSIKSPFYRGAIQILETYPIMLQYLYCGGRRTNSSCLFKSTKASSCGYERYVDTGLALCFMEQHYQNIKKNIIRENLVGRSADDTIGAQ